MAKHSNEPPVSVITQTPLGNVDIHNVSGRMKQRLINEGRMTADKFTQPPNTTGKKLESLRNKVDAVDPTKLKIGDMVEFRKKVSQVVEMHEKKGVKITKGKNEISKWIPFNRIKTVNPEED